MTRDEKLILAITEAMILWDRISETGDTKYETIAALHQEGKLHKKDYQGGCPLCDGLRCGLCPWPVYADDKQCLSNESPFYYWRLSKHPATRKAAAKKVLDLLLSIEF